MAPPARVPLGPATLVAVAAVTAAAAVAWAVRGPGPDVAANDRVAITEVPVAPAPAPPGPRASRGSYQARCGRNEEGRHNEDNVVLSPGVNDAAHHVHDYVGNTSTSASSTDATLASAPTTCADGRDRSSYFWPVLRDGDGAVVAPAEVRIVWHGNRVGPVVPGPRFLRLSTGNAHGPASVHVGWTCSGSPDRRTERYPRCPEGQRVVRRFDFPGCWDGLGTDSPDHRRHVAFATAAGTCPSGTFPIPQLRIEVAYDLAAPVQAEMVIDTFPEVHGDPRADHAHAIDVMDDGLRSLVVDCLNQGRAC